MPGDFRCDRGDYARVFVFYHTRGCGCIERPAFPAPSDIQGEGHRRKTSGRTCSEIAKLRLPSLLGSKRRSNPLFLWGYIDFFTLLSITLSFAAILNLNL